MDTAARMANMARTSTVCMIANVTNTNVTHTVADFAVAHKGPELRRGLEVSVDVLEGQPGCGCSRHLRRPPIR